MFLNCYLNCYADTNLLYGHEQYRFALTLYCNWMLVVLLKCFFQPALLIDTMIIGKAFMSFVAKSHLNCYAHAISLYSHDQNQFESNSVTCFTLILCSNCVIKWFWKSVHLIGTMVIRKAFMSLFCWGNI